MSECKYCKSKERPSYDSDTRYECGSHFYFSSHYNQSNACKRITTLEQQVKQLEDELAQERAARFGHSYQAQQVTINPPSEVK